VMTVHVRGHPVELRLQDLGIKHVFVFHAGLDRETRKRGRLMPLSVM
jgi:hypothetical protein